MRGLNVFHFSGTFGHDPEMRFSPSGTQVVRVNLAVSNDKYNKETQSWDSQTDWIPLVFFGKIAERVAEQYAKGTRCIVSGSVRTNTYVKDGENRKSFSFIVDDFCLITKGADSNHTESAPQADVAQSEAEDLAPWDS